MIAVVCSEQDKKTGGSHNPTTEWHDDVAHCFDAKTGQTL
jgi:hypothetical protein